MIIKGVKSIRNVDKYIKDLESNSTYIIGFEIDDDISEKLINLGFPENLNPGYSLLPDFKNGRTSKYNALGKVKIRKDLPKVDHSFTVNVDIKDWHGNTHSVTQNRTVKRFPREAVPAPEIEVQIVENEEKNKFITASNKVIIDQTDKDLLKHIINLFLELFGQAQFLKEDLNSIPTIETVRLNWVTLPQGDLPWEQRSSYIKDIAAVAKKSQRAIVTERLEKIENFNPDFRALGINGYRGYVIYGFEDKELYVFESGFYGNATYIFKGDWEEISKLTKAEIINEELYEHRLIHQQGWQNEVTDILSN